MVAAAHGTRKPRRVTTDLPASWEGIGYLMEKNRDDGRGRGIGHRNSHSPNESNGESSEMQNCEILLCVMRHAKQCGYVDKPHRVDCLT
ncbi:hypothetical protein EVAR_61421_1 [Eumeta japonica]|uniref:Uncharacterized protein n=1 Tax=Eumeta variegata TaxID=151549 RepID=A0A4C1Y3N4_EUMVA|nr:hypothetical protein EVAR_61421_1 [Eumeta japonica]